MEPSVLGSAFMEGGPDRKIKLDRSPGVDEVCKGVKNFTLLGPYMDVMLAINQLFHIKFT